MAILNLIPYEGSIKIDGVEARDIPPDMVHRVFTVIPQRPILVPSATIRQNLVLEEIMFDHTRNDDVIQIDQILFYLGLSEIITQSGGMHAPFSRLRLTPSQLQRFAVAQGLMKYFYLPSRMVLNDSSANIVDAESLERISYVTREIFGWTGSTVIQTASDMPLLQRGTWLGFIRRGEIRHAAWYTGPGSGPGN